MGKIDPNAFVTNKTLDEAVETILQGMDGMITEFRIEVKQGFDQMGSRINILEENLTNRASLSQFTQLKSKVDKHLIN